MKSITTIVLVSILNSSQPQPVVLDSTEIAMSEIKRKRRKARRLRRRAKRRRKDSFQNSKVLSNAKIRQEKQRKNERS